MPSWNIHTAHVEGLLATQSAAELGIEDVDAFLFGNFVPDIYVGYVVPDVSHKIPYKDTHLVDPTFIPSPNAALFYERYLMGECTDVVLGAWTHLLCDHYYNRRTNEYISRIGVAPGEQTRIRKQSDFDAFGRTLSISRVPKASEGILSQCKEFPQYAIGEQDVLATIRAQEGIVHRNAAEHLDTEPEYLLLTQEFFESTYRQVDSVLHEAFRLRASGVAPLELGRA